MTEHEPLLSVRNLVTEFIGRGAGRRQRNERHRVVDKVSFDIAPGETLGLVGESGSGKTTLARTILRLIPAAGGSVSFDGVDLLRADRRTLKRLRRQIGVVFQDPTGSLNPRMRIGRIVGEPLLIHRLARGKRLTQRVCAALERVGLPGEYAERFPHELSGGQRQRVGIARAIVIEPKLVICDEPVSSLDVSIQAQIINLLDALQGDMGVAYLFIAHNLAVVRHVADRVAVMHQGRIVELADAETLFHAPRHPYTRSLLRAAPTLQPKARSVPLNL